MKRTSNAARKRSNNIPSSRARSTNKSRRAQPSRAKSNSRALNQEWFKDFLCEMHAVELGGVKLYEKAAEELTHDKYRAQIEKFLEQTRRHVELCQEMMEAASIPDGDGSPGAEAAEHKAEGLLSTQVPEHLLDLNNFENLVLAETKDHWNWEMLATVAGEIDDTSLKRLVGRAVREVRKQEADHLARMQRALTEIAAELAHQTMDGSGSEETD
jgi:ferritin-like metal-binding protein YciE